jgi:hypothetical protein
MRILGMKTAMKKSPQKGMVFVGMFPENQAISNPMRGKKRVRTRNQVAMSLACSIIVIPLFVRCYGNFI